MSSVKKKVTANTSRRLKDAYKILDCERVYSLDDLTNEALNTYREKFASKKMVESVDIHINLNSAFNPSAQSVQGSVELPHGTGKKVRVVAFVTPDKQDLAIKAGAQEADLDILIQKILENKIDFDIAIATPDVMPKLSKIAKVLGPRGLMPSNKNGTLTSTFEKAIKSAAAGLVTFKASKNRCIFARVGSIAFSSQQIKENIESLTTSVLSSAKGMVGTIFVSTTFGPSFKVKI